MTERRTEAASFCQFPGENFTAGRRESTLCGMSSELPPDDPALAAAVRIQRRRHAWALAMIWLIGVFLLLAGSAAEASDDDTPAPAWFIELMLLAAVLVVVTLAVVIGYSVAMSRRPAELRAQAIALERQRLRGRWRHSWRRRASHALYWLALSLGMAMFLVMAVVGVPWVINGAAYLAGGGGPAVRWATPPIHNDGDAATSLIVGLLFVFTGVLVLLFIYRRATRVWWPRLLARQAAGAELPGG